MRRQERRTNAEGRRRIDDLLARVTSAREQIVEAGLDAVQNSRAADEASRTSGGFTRTPTDGAPTSSVSSRGTRFDA
jgi:hypothetical protein